jgi:hypothetical protein
MRMKRDGKSYLRMRDAIAETCQVLVLRPDQNDSGPRQFALSKALKGLIWHYSEQTSIPGDCYDSCPFWSKQAVELNVAHGGRAPRNQLHFEHVFPRENIEHALRHAETPEHVRNVLDGMRTCVVTHAEHTALRKVIFRHTGEIQHADDWWKRYTAAKITICKGPRYDAADSDAGAVFDRIFQVMGQMSWSNVQLEKTV